MRQCAVVAVALLLSGCASTSVMVKPSPNDPNEEIVVTRRCAGTGPMQHRGVYSFQLTRMVWEGSKPMLILAVPLDLLFLPIQAFKDLCFTPCNTSEETRKKTGTIL